MIEQGAPQIERERSVAWRWLLAGAAFFLLLIALVLLFGLNMRRGLNHDEHQFVASGALIGRYGLLPYRDFPYFHVPTLSIIYALLFQRTDYLLLAARTFSVVCGWLLLVLVFVVALLRLRNLSLVLRITTGVLGALLLLAAPSFIFTSGRAWNHDLPVLLVLLAAVLASYWLRRPAHSLLWLAGTGLLVGLAAGTRSSYMFAALPFAIMIFLVLPWRSRRAWAALVVLAVGGIIGAAPAIYTFAVAPERFIFGNLTYARLNTEYYQLNGAGQPGMTILQKIVFTFELVFLQPGNLLILLLAVLEMWRVRRSLRVSVAPELYLGLLLLLSFLVGAYAPTPMQQQYIYPIIPLLLLLFIGALAYDRRPRIPIGVLGISTFLALALAAPRYAEGAEIVFDPSEWFPLKVHARGERLAELVDDKRVLTLAPIYPLEGGASIYPELVTGPLGWRVAPLLSAEERTQVGLVGLDELSADLAGKSPRGVLVGVHADDATAEAPLLSYANQGGYVPVAMPEEGTLWTAPIAKWGEQVQLGAAELPSYALSPGEKFVATLHLEALAPFATDLNVLVRVIGSDGTEVLRQEGWPWGRPTTSWETGEVWPDGHEFTLPADIAPGPYKVEVTFYDPTTLALVGEPATAGYIVVDGQDSAGTTPLAKFADGIVLQSAKIPEDGWKSGATQQVQLTWEGLQPDRGNYTVFLHLAGPNGLVAQRDQAPFGGFYPTNAWLPRLPVDDRYTLELPAELAPGTYTLLAGLYDPVTGQRLALMDGDRVAGDAFAVATVQVE